MVEIHLTGLQFKIPGRQAALPEATRDTTVGEQDAGCGKRWLTDVAAWASAASVKGTLAKQLQFQTIGQIQLRTVEGRKSSAQAELLGEIQCGINGQVHWHQPLCETKSTDSRSLPSVSATD